MKPAPGLTLRSLLPGFLGAFLALSCPLIPGAEAARKYYPPGYSPEDAPSTETPAAVEPQVLIRTIRVPVSGRPARPKDPIAALVDEQRYFDALRLIDQRLEKNPGNLYLHILRGQVFRADGDRRAAEAAFALVLDRAKTPDLRARAFQGLGTTRLMEAHEAQRRGDDRYSRAVSAEASALLQEALKLAPRMLEARVGLAEAALLDGDPARAEDILRDVPRSQKETPEVLALKSRLHLFRGQFKEAQALAYAARQAENEQARDTAPDAAIDRLLGEIALALDRPDDAIIHLKRAQARLPGDGETLQLLSRAYEKKMKPEDAETALRKAVALDPANIEAIDALTGLYVQRGEAARTIPLLQGLLADTETPPPGKTSPPGLRQSLQARLLAAHIRQEAWGDAYRTGRSMFGPGNTAGNPALPEKAIADFCRAAYLSGAAFSDYGALQQDPGVQALATRLRAQAAATPDDPKPALHLLLLDPAGDVPLPAEVPLSSAGLQVAFLARDPGAFRDAVRRYRDTRPPAAEVLATALDLSLLGDTEGSLMLAVDLLDRLPEQHTLYGKALALRDRLKQRQAETAQGLRLLRKLPANSPETFWAPAMTQLLSGETRNPEMHAIFAERYRRTGDREKAFLHQKLLSRYAETRKDREKWARRASETQSATPGGEAARPQ